MTKEEAMQFMYFYFRDVHSKEKDSPAFILSKEFIEARDILGEDLTRDIYEDTRPEPNTWDISGDL